MIAKLMLVAFAAALPLSGAVAAGAPGRPPAMDTAAWASIDAAARAEVEDKQLPSLVVAIAGRDGILWSRAYGFEDAAETRPATLDSIYRVGSITDALTELLVMEARGFTVYEAEWWHFDFNGWQDFPISNVEFSAIGR